MIGLPVRTHDTNGSTAGRRPRVSSAIVNAFTVDVEDYYQVSAFEKHVDRVDWDRYESRVGPNTRRLLDLLDHHQVQATFFVLGWVAQRQPDLVRDIHRRGHEIGSHGYWHRLIYDQSPQEFRDDLRQSRDVLDSILGTPVTAYRAPSFSITSRSRWALEILGEEGFLVDSSVFPIHHDRYGIPGAPRRLHRIATASGTLWEFPPSVARLARLNIPVGGGGISGSTRCPGQSAAWRGSIAVSTARSCSMSIHGRSIRTSRASRRVPGWPASGTTSTSGRTTKSWKHSSSDSALAAYATRSRGTGNLRCRRFDDRGVNPFLNRA